MPSSVSVGSRPPSSCLIFSYSSGVIPCSRTTSGVMTAVAAVVIWGSSIVAFREGRRERKIGTVGADDSAEKSDSFGRSSPPATHVADFKAIAVSYGKLEPKEGAGGRKGRFNHRLKCPLIAFRSDMGATWGRGDGLGRPSVYRASTRV